MKIFLGIDGGGTKTSAILVDESGRVIGQGEAGPSNFNNAGMSLAIANVREAMVQAWLDANVSARVPDGAFLGCAGIKSAADIAGFTSAAEIACIAPPGEITVANDLHNALTGGLAGRSGIALIAGTGTNCLGRDASGKTFMCGGWGWLLDDMGGGFGLAVTAMRAAVKSADGRLPETRLLPALLAFFGLSEANEVLDCLYTKEWKPDELASFTPILMRFAEEGDAVSLDILKEGAKELASLVAGTARMLDFIQGPEVVLLGGCAQNSAFYRPLIEAAIAKACPSARIVPPAFSPWHGAALNALRAAGITPLPSLTTPDASMRKR